MVQDTSPSDFSPTNDDSHLLITAPATTPSDPSFTSASASSTISSGGTTHPFSGVTLADPGTDATETLTVSFGGGTLSGTGFTQASAGTYIAIGTVAQINADLAGATFTDTFVTSSDAFTKTDYITLNDTGSANGVPSTGSASLTDMVDVQADYVSGPSPSFSSTQPTVTLVSGQTVHPLAGVTLSDTSPAGFVPSETLTAVVTGGTFSGTGFTHTTAGTYVATGTAAQINADLAAASFTDTRASGTATDIISLSDTATVAATTGASAHPAVTTVSVNVTQPVPSHPSFTDNSNAVSSVSSGGTTHPFTRVMLVDPGTNATETLTVNAQSGTFSGSGFTETSAGTFVAMGTVAQINADLAGARFTDTAYSTVVHGLKGDPITVTDVGSVAGVSSAIATLAVEVDFMTQQPPPCFATGTLIRTEAGDVAVETLRVGDLVCTAWGGLRPVRWLGHRRVDCRRHPEPERVRPVRVRAHSFGDGLPARDLVLSPEHALFLDEHLVPVHLLVDGVSVVQEAWERVTYHHVELDRHDVLMAEGMAAESYLDTGNRAQFANNPLVTLHASYDPGMVPAEPCAPLLINGPRLQMLRDTLQHRIQICAA